MTPIRSRAVVAIGLLLGCRATTSRPYFVPFPEAEHGQIGFGLINPAGTVGQVTDTVLAYLLRDSIPITTVRRFDGFLETGWFDTTSLAPTHRRPIGDGVVRVRAYIDPGQPGFAHVEIETVYVPFADPSLSAREQEAPVAALHGVNRRVAAVLEQLKKKYGAPEDEGDKAKAARDAKPGMGKPRAPGDSALVADSTAKVDSSKAAPAKPDTTAKRDTTGVKLRFRTSRT